MGKKFLKTLTNNIGFKILALFVAFIMWLVVYNTNDPSVTKTFTATIALENASALAEQNLSYEVVGGGTISVAVTGKRSIITNLEDSDFTATADLSRIQINKEEMSALATLEFKSTRYNNQLKFSGGVKHLRLALENIIQTQFSITSDVTGQVAAGYTLGEVSVSSPTVLKVSGPESVVKKIKKVIATVDVTNATADVKTTVVPDLVDANGNLVDTTKLELSSSTVMLEAEILYTKSVTIGLNHTGTPANGLSVIGVTSDIQSVMVKGTAAALNGMSSIDIPEDVINVEGATGSYTTSINISEYLPEGVKLVDSKQANITVTIEIEEYVTKNFSINTSTLAIKGLSDDNTLTYTEDAVEVAVNGKASDIELLTTAMLSGTIDVSNMGLGPHTAAITFDLKSDDYTIGRTTVAFVISQKEDPTTVPPQNEGTMPSSESEKTNADAETTTGR